MSSRKLVVFCWVFNYKLNFIGFSDEILDIALVGKEENHFAVATNSKDIKIYNNVSMSCALVQGHEDLVLALSVSPVDRDLMLSSGKDNSVRLWHFENGGARYLLLLHVILLEILYQYRMKLNCAPPQPGP